MPPCRGRITSYIEKLIGYVIAIFALLVVMIVVMVVAHKAQKGFRHVIRWQAAIAFIAIVAVLVNVICYGPMYNNVSSVLNAKKVVLAQETTDQSRATIPDTFVYSTFHCLVQLHVCRIVTYFGNILCIFF